MSYWRTLFDRSRKPSKSYYPVTPVDPPSTTTVTTATVSQAPPSPLTVTTNPVISAPHSPPQAGDTITAIHAVYSGAVTGYSGQWYSGASPISLATALTYVAQNSDFGNLITYRESGTNGVVTSVMATSNALGPVAASTLATNDGTSATAPQISGIPRENETAWLGSGIWVGPVNVYRFKLFRDGALFNTITQSGDTLELTWATADVGHAITAAAEASTDGGATWSAAATALPDYLFQSDLITPATIAAPTIVRTSASGDVVLIYRIDAPALYNSYVIRQQRFTHAGAFVEQNYIAVSESGLGSLTINTSSAVDPAPYPAPLGTLATDDVVKVSIQSADYEADGSILISGVTSPTTDVNVSDVVSAMTWSVTDNAVPSGTALSLSPDNLTVTDATAGVSGIRASRAVAFDKTYWEVSGNTAPWGVAVADSTAALTTGWGAGADGQTPTAHAVNNYDSNGGIISYNGSRAASSIRTSTDIGCIALDRVALKAWFGHITGGVTTWYNGSPSAGTGGQAITGIGTPLYPAAQLLNGNVAILNPGTTPGGTAGFTGAVPTGFFAP